MSVGPSPRIISRAKNSLSCSMNSHARIFDEGIFDSGWTGDEPCDLIVFLISIEAAAFRLKPTSTGKKLLKDVYFYDLVTLVHLSSSELQCILS